MVADTLTISGVQDNGLLYHSGINNSSSNLALYAGQAGNIDVTANKITISDGGAINTSAMNAGGGHISINARELIYLSDQGRITTSVNSGVKDGGNINITNPQFTVLNQGKITAQAHEGRGGNIHIAAEQFIKSQESLINASSKLGLDGDVQIDSPTVDLNAMLVLLPGAYVQEAQLKNCTSEEIDNPSTFKIELAPDRVVPFGN